VELTDQLNQLNLLTSASTRMTSLQEQEQGQGQDQAAEEEMQGKNKQAKFLREEAIHCSSKAVSLLTRMEQLYQEIPGKDFRPALSTYTSVINSIIRTSEIDPSSAKTNSATTTTTTTATTTTANVSTASTTATSNNNEGAQEGQAQETANANANANAQEQSNGGVDLASQWEIIERIRSRRDEIYKQRNDVDHRVKIRVTSIQHVLDILEHFREQEYEYSNGNNNGNANANDVDVDGALDPLAEGSGSGSEIAPHELFARLKYDMGRPFPIGSISTLLLTHLRKLVRCGRLMQPKVFWISCSSSALPSM